MTKIAEKIAKIIEKAKSTDAAGEAEVLMAKAFKMMEEHSLSMSDLVTQDPIGTNVHTKVYWNRSGYFHQNLYWALARYYGCRGVANQVGANKFEMSVTGRESARATFEAMAPWIAKEVTRQASALVKDGKSKSLSTAKRQVANALSGRIWRLVADAEADTKRFATGNPNALVPVDMIKAAEEEAFPSATAANTKRKATTHAAKAAAANISLAKQVNGGAAKQLR